MVEVIGIADRAAVRTTAVRLDELRRLLGALAPEEAPSGGQLDALATLIFDAGLVGDQESLRLAVDHLRRDYASRSEFAEEMSEEVRAGVLLGYLKIALWALECAPNISLPTLPPESNAARLLRAIAEQPGASNRQLAVAAALRDDQVSRHGRELVEAALAMKRRIGQENAWVVTPRGQEVLRADAAQRDPAPSPPIAPAAEEQPPATIQRDPLQRVPPGSPYEVVREYQGRVGADAAVRVIDPVEIRV